MKPKLRTTRMEGFNGWDLLICCVIVVLLLVGIYLPNMIRPRPAQRDSCISNLKQIALAFRMWANDHEDKLPMEVSALSSNRGTMEFNLSGEVWRHFLALTQELVTPKVLACPKDKRRSASSWQLLTNHSHLSYFVGLDADKTKPQTILAGDRNVATTAKPINGVISVRPNDQVEWTKELHVEYGNIALTDGSAHQMTPGSLAKQFQAVFLSTTQTVYRLALPQ